MTHMKANDLAALDRAHALHPWQNLDPDPGDSPLVISRGEGCHLWDADGRQYLDAVGGLWCTQIGLGNAEMAKAIADQAQRLAFSSTFTDITNDPAALLAARLAALAPDGLSRVHFTTGGSTAIDSAYRMVQFVQAARGFPERTHVVARQHSYHGSTLARHVRSGARRDRGCRGVHLQGRHDPPCIRAQPLSAAPRGLENGDLTDHIWVAEFAGRDRADRWGRAYRRLPFAEPRPRPRRVLVRRPITWPGWTQVCPPPPRASLFAFDEVVTGSDRLGGMVRLGGRLRRHAGYHCAVARSYSSGYQPHWCRVSFTEELFKDMEGHGW